MKEPIVNPLISLSKKYISAFSTRTEALAIERYQYVLVLIEENKETLTQKAISELLNLDKSFIVSIINYLTAKGYVYRETNQTDKRKQIIRLTDKAWTDLPIIKEAFAEINNQSFKGLSSRQIENFYSTIQLMEKNLSTSDPTAITFNIKRRPVNQ